MPHNNSKINELEDRIRNLLLGNPDLAQQLIDNILDRGLLAVNKQKSDLITATECQEPRILRLHLILQVGYYHSDLFLYARQQLHCSAPYQDLVEICMDKLSHSCSLQSSRPQVSNFGSCS